MNKQQAVELTQEIAPILWLAHNLTVVRDGHTVEGVRIHFVKEEGYNGQIIDNALVFSA